MPKIMLVEDDNNLREIYGERLMAEGYEIVSAGDGEEALALAVKEKPDLIISDVMMPKISGFDMLDILRQTPETKFTKVIMMTALSQSEDKDRADRLGADKYLVKSQVTLEDVARVVHDLIYGPEAQEAAAASAGPDTAPQQPVVTAPVAVAVEPVIEAATPVEAPVMPATPMAAEQPAVTPMAEPVIETPAAAPPTMPEITAPQAVSAPLVTTQPVAEPVAPIVNPITGGVTPEVATTTFSDDSAAPQSAADETAAIAAQIENFVANNMPATEPANASPLVEPSEQDLIHAQNAVEDPNVIKPTLPEEPADPSVPPVIDDSDNPEPAGVRKKIIQPINDPSAAQPNIYELYEKEMAQEAANSPVVAPPQTANSMPAGNPIVDNALPASNTTPTLEVADTSNITGLSFGDNQQIPTAAVPVPTELNAPAPQPPVETVPDPNDPASFAL